MKRIALFGLCLALLGSAIAPAPASAQGDCASMIGDGASSSDLRRAIQCLSSRLDRLEGRGNDGTFFSAVVAFDNYVCPNGWIPYEAATGRVLVGAGSPRRPGDYVSRTKGEAPRIAVAHPSAAAEEVEVGPGWVALVYCKRLQ